MKPGEIWFIRDPKLGALREGHYVLVTQQFANKVVFNWITTKNYSSKDFCIDQQKYKSNFDASGLLHTSHLIFEDGVVEAVMSTVKGQHRGELTGKLRTDVEKWWGEKF